MLYGPGATVVKARKLRKAMSLPEVVLWRALRDRPGGLKFRRQHPAGSYVADFFCAEARLAVEVDGMAHDMGDQPARDMRRDGYFEAQGVRVLRVPAAMVLKDVGSVVTGIVAAAAIGDQDAQ